MKEKKKAFHLNVSVSVCALACGVSDSNICPSRVRRCLLCHRGARAAGCGQRGFREVRRCSPQHREIRYSAAEDHQTCEYRSKSDCFLSDQTDFVINGMEWVLFHHGGVLLCVSRVDLTTWLPGLTSPHIMSGCADAPRPEHVPAQGHTRHEAHHPQVPGCEVWISGEAAALAVSSVAVQFTVRLQSDCKNPLCLSVVLPEGEGDGWWRIQQYCEFDWLL